MGGTRLASLPRQEGFARVTAPVCNLRHIQFVVSIVCLMSADDISRIR